MAANETTMTQTGDTGGQGSGEISQGASSHRNVGEPERWASAVGGGALALYGLTRGTLGGVALALAGGALLYRGVSGHCNVYEAMGVSSADEGGRWRSPVVSVKGGSGVKVEKSVIINRSPEELYSYWRNFENLPRIMSHLESVHTTGEGRSHWVAKGPAGTTVEWDAEVYNEKENEMIAWRSLEGADVDNAGSVHFTPAPGGRGTQVRVVVKYDPPAGKVGAAVAKLLGEEPSGQIQEDLRRFKQFMETGETLTTEGQSSGRAASAGRQ
ncbi:MAG TPA: SRPBCC family protein [Pyrinomonadaceae bacterium]|nr:SRPBCC family protein [Pyrinomonadaceae bacterium]